MKQIEIADATHDRLVVAARLMDLTVGEVVAELVDRLAGGADVARPSTDVSRLRRVPSAVGGESDWIPVYKVYKGNRIEGAFSLRNHRIQLKTSPWINMTFASPTAAAVAVVEHFSSDVRDTTNTNGRKFWKVEETGKNLHSLIGER